MARKAVDPRAERLRKMVFNASTRKMWLTARARAARKDVPFTITVEDIDAVWPEDNRCPILGLEFERNTVKGPLPSSPTLDRIYPDRGYVPGNIAVVSHRANTLKSNASREELQCVLRWLDTNN